jgi:hypothetical protein
LLASMPFQLARRLLVGAAAAVRLQSCRHSRIPHLS